MAETWAGCEIRDGLLYDLDADVWVAVEGEVVRLGMTDVAQSRMGKLVQLSWKQPGRKVRRGRPLSVLESAKWVGPMISPVTGEIIATNEETFRRDSAIANRDPYGEGWLYEIRLADTSELERLADAKRAFAHYKDVIDASGLRCFRCEDPPIFVDDDT
jgi:glycine cleavage system H protein